MPITYNKLYKLMEQKNITMYKLRKDKIVGTVTYQRLSGNKPGSIDTRTIENLCRYLDCQPGDIMEYVPDGEENDQEI